MKKLILLTILSMICLNSKAISSYRIYSICTIENGKVIEELTYKDNEFMIIELDNNDIIINNTHHSYVKYSTDVIEFANDYYLKREYTFVRNKDLYKMNVLKRTTTLGTTFVVPLGKQTLLVYFSYD